MLANVIKKREANLAKSSATDSNWALPAPEGEEYFGYQKAGIQWQLEHKNSYIADDMGLGKTIQAIGLINADPTIERVLIITKSSLKVNWENELKTWLVRPLSVGICWGSDWPAAQIIIINYDILDRHKFRLDSVSWDLIVSDEAQFIKNPKAMRTKMVLGYEPKKDNPKNEEAFAPLKARYKSALSGSPIENRPVEMFGVLHWLDPKSWPSFWWFAQTFCGATHNGYGWDFSGSSNEEQFQELLRKSVMIRRTKDEVDLDLPDKRYQILEVPVESPKLARELAREVDHFRKATDSIRKALKTAREAGNAAEFRKLVGELDSQVTISFEEYSRQRRELADLKIPYAIQYLKETLTDDPHKMLVFAHHHHVLERLHREFQPSALVYGPTPAKKRQPIIDQYNGDPSMLPFFGSIQAAGVGLNLTSAWHVLFVEEDVVPERMNQAADRSHRIGQTHKVLVTHLVLQNSMDVVLAQIAAGKSSIIDVILGKGANSGPIDQSDWGRDYVDADKAVSDDACPF